ncbi:sensor histidine kinase [Vibrio sp. SCSIO 43137]|uniref:sensor histidine kinase n=1 Tax=Vibrio sp. SCSIO 43137 TaxID=3021011 RepID=UPI0023080DF1|nr:histidine kinase [Vibrio sp. SCSIO 43137]WCE32211.1 histidine kinase [Vibrio sp. SCSIO 43137]
MASFLSKRRSILGVNIKVRFLLYLLIWPLFNLVNISIVTASATQISIIFIVSAAIKIWSIFIVFFILTTITEKLLQGRVVFNKFISNLMIYLMLIICSVLLSDLTIYLLKNQEYPEFRVGLLLFLMLQVVLYLTILYVMVEREKQLAMRMNIKLIESEALRAQSNPHFLFNTLNVIAADAVTSPQRSQQLIYDLSDLLRKTVDMSTDTLVPLCEELEIVQLYMTLQQSRYEDKLHYKVECDSSCNTMAVPPLILLPIIENAITHGIAPYVNDGKIWVSIKKIDDDLYIKVSDNGPSFDDKNIRLGTGLKIVTETLRVYYPDNSYFMLESLPSGGCVTVKLPAKVYSPQEIQKQLNLWSEK